MTLLKFLLQNTWICIAVCTICSKPELEATQDKITAAVDSMNECCGSAKGSRTLCASSAAALLVFGPVMPKGGLTLLVLGV